MPDKLLDKKFEEKYKNLNKEQKQAIDSIDGPVMVIAGPGTGKTTILTLRIANILRETDTPANGILALTFTEAGAKVMRLKLREIIGSRADDVRIHTFHGFAASVIAEFSDHFPHLSRSTQLTDIESENYLRGILKDKKFSKLRPLGDPEYYVLKILNAIRDSKKEAWSADTLRVFARGEIERIKNDESSISTRGLTKGKLKAEALKRIEKCERTLLLADIFELYESKKREDRKIDFDDLLSELLSALKNDDLLLKLLQEKFLYILVDEHQDTNDSQNLIVTTLANFFEKPNVFVVGDEKQAIYRFQGASVANFLRFQEVWKDMEVISLKSNYRSHQSILDAAFSMIEMNYEEDEHKNLRVKLSSESANKSKPVDVVNAENSPSADNYLVDKLKELSEKDETVAIIVRKNKEVERILTLCEDNGIKASAERGADIFSHPMGLLYFDLLEFIVDPTKVESLANTIAGGLWGMDFNKGAEVIKKIRSGNYEIEKDIPNLSKIRNEVNNLGVIEFLIFVADLSNFTDMALKNPMSSEVWRGIVNLAKDIVEANNIQSADVLMKELLSYKKSAETKTIKINSGVADAKIQIMTAHASKGLEFDYVFLPFATEEFWMRHSFSSVFVLPQEKGEGDEVKDSRRLFYVAITRARKHVEIIVPLENEGGKILTPLRFISELDKNHIKVINNPKAKEVLVSKTSEKVSAKRKQDMIEYAKSVILEKGLSVTALNHFLCCPREFFFKSILKLPEAPSATSEKGIAMHKALSNVWQSDNRSVKNTTNIIEKTVKDFFEKSLLSLNEKEIVTTELITNAPIVAEALNQHFNIKEKVLTETWVNFESIFKVNNKEVLVKLHGQLDAIVDAEKKVSVFDYKTREALSVNAIKGETKDSSGDYFRQLIFYRILLENNSFYREKEIIPALVFVKPDEKGRCPIISLDIEKLDTERVLGEVETLLTSVWSGEFLEEECEDKDCEYCRRFKI